MLKPLWEEIWIGILGIYCAVGLKNGNKYAWTLSLFWGIMMLSNAAIQGIYVLVVLKWSTACLQTYFFLFVGAVAFVSMLIARNRYFNNQPGEQK